MSQLSELEMRILSELEEAGEENVPTLINTVLQATGDESEVDQMRVALEALVRADLVRMSVDRDASRRLRALPKDESLAVIADVSPNLRFKADRGVWCDVRRTGPPFSSPYPYVVDTDAGRVKATEILAERGYQWWRQTM